MSIVPCECTDRARLSLHGVVPGLGFWPSPRTEKAGYHHVHQGKNYESHEG